MKRLLSCLIVLVSLLTAPVSTPIAPPPAAAFPGPIIGYKWVVYARQTPASPWQLVGWRYNQADADALAAQWQAMGYETYIGIVPFIVG